MRDDRRRALKVIAGACGGWLIGCGPRSGSPDGGDPGDAGQDLANMLVMVPLADVAVGAFVMKSEVLIARDAQGVYALTAICTHEGCYVITSDATCGGTSVLMCPCHCSRFSADGAVVNGPAEDPLVNFAVTVSAGMIAVDKSQPVPAGTRAPA
jgi:Rieske Fe-S protein